MNGDKLLDAMEYIDADLIEAADGPVKKRRKPWWIAAVAAVLAVIVTVTLLWRPQPEEGAPFPELEVKATYPQMAIHPLSADFDNNMSYSEALRAWERSYQKQYRQPRGYADSLRDFFVEGIPEFLKGDGNPTCSPINVYMAMAMLAEIAAGKTRQQILDLFGLDTIDQLREQASHVWNAHYCNDGKSTMLLNNSVWLDNDYSFRQETAESLSRYYYASSYSGDLGSAEMNKKLQNWLNENTGGLLEEQANRVTLDPQTIFSLASTAYFSDEWQTEFHKNNTKNAVFKGTSGNVDIPFMNRTFWDCLYYRGKNFGAIALDTKAGHHMWLILPDKGVSTADVLKDGTCIQMTLRDYSGVEYEHYKLNLSMPKFDIEHNTDLVSSMKKLGVTRVFNSITADFSPLTNADYVFVNQVRHSVRVAVDEKGCTAAAFTVILLGGGGTPELEEMDFVLDRPFIFIISSRDNLPLFAGIVNEP